MKIFIFVGLPRTATTFYQENFFPRLEKYKIIYNPYVIISKINYFVSTKRNISSKKIQEFRTEVNTWAKKNPKKILFIVNEHLGYKGWCPDPKKGSSLTKKLFPNAKIIISIRYQTDWLQSLYKHYMDVGGISNINEFLNHVENKFINKDLKEEFDRYGNLKVKMNIYKLDWYLYIKCFIDLYGSKNVKILFFEEFIMNKKEYTKNLMNYFGIKARNFNINYNKKKNTGRSAFTCLLTVIKGKLLNSLNISARPVKQFNWKLAELRSEKKNQKNIFKFFYYYFELLILIMKHAPWQFFMTRLDQLLYIDWNVISKAKLKNELDLIYKNQNKKLIKIINRKKIPSKYLH